MLYTAPEAQLLVVHSEGFVCASATLPIDGFQPDPNPMSTGLDFNPLNSGDLGLPIF
ncbi:MAG: hypothetical protein J6X99_04135 [Bacteroidales bacterium]|nr:hypothetical protein [Bacteroidales bacterium]